jgi:Tfp pilus assembly protein PilO
VNVKKRKLTPGVTAAIGVGITLLIAAAGWFLLVSPQRSRSSSLDEEIALVEAQIDESHRAEVEAGQVKEIRVADLFRLTKAMPEDNDMAGVLLELSQVAGETGIVFEQIVPQPTLTAGEYRAQPIELVFTGNFYELSDFLYRLRNLVSVQRGRLLANGRLFAVDSLQFVESEDHFPNIKALLRVSAFLYGKGPVVGAPPVSAVGTTTDTTATTSTDTTATTETTTTDGAAAVGAP